MKRRIIPGIVLLFLAAVAAVGSRTFMAPCAHADGSFGACHWAGRTLLGLSCVLGITAVISVCVPRARFGAYLSALPVSLLAIRTPGSLIALRRSDAMRCRMVTRPAAILLFSASLLCALIGALLNTGKAKRE